MPRSSPSHPTAAPDAAGQRRAVGMVVAVLDDDVVVNVDGVLRRAAPGHVTRLRIGDWVTIALGSVLGVVDGTRRVRR